MSARNEAEGLKYGLAETAKVAKTFDFSRFDLGQRDPQQNPHPPGHPEPVTAPSPLGIPMKISEVAQLLGCSEWTVRQRYMPQGLPCLRASATGKLVFFHKQVIDWILRQQQKKGGILR